MEKEMTNHTQKQLIDLIRLRENEIKRLYKRLSEEKRKNRKLETILKFYAKLDSYEPTYETAYTPLEGREWQKMYIPVARDNGDRARRILRETKNIGR